VQMVLAQHLLVVVEDIHFWIREHNIIQLATP